MAHKKTGISVTPPVEVDPKSIMDTAPPKVGDERDGMVWDGEEWIPKDQWEATSGPEPTE